MRLEDLRGRAVVSVPEAGSLFGLKRTHSYEAAARGQLPTISFGSRKVVPVAALLKLLGNEEGTEQNPVPSPQPTPTGTPLSLASERRKKTNDQDTQTG